MLIQLAFRREGQNASLNGSLFIERASEETADSPGVLVLNGKVRLPVEPILTQIPGFGGSLTLPFLSDGKGPSLCLSDQGRERLLSRISARRSESSLRFEALTAARFFRVAYLSGINWIRSAYHAMSLFPAASNGIFGP